MKKIMFLFLLLFSLNGCSKTVLDYDSFTHLNSWEEISNLNHDALIYYYDPFCATCERIKDDVLNNLHELSKTHTIYLINNTAVHDQEPPSFDESPSTPSLIIYQNDTVHVNKGASPILSTLSNLLD